MARPPLHERPLGEQWLHAILAPRNFGRNAVVVVILVILAFHNQILWWLNAQLANPNSALNALIVLAIAIWAFYFFFVRPWLPKKKKGKGDH